MRRVAYVLLVLECVVILIPSIYGRLTPKLFGIPFFYWFQLLWILVAMVVTGVVYLLTTTRGPAPSRSGAASEDAHANRGPQR
jgi:hypothetical protein